MKKITYILCAFVLFICLNASGQNNLVPGTQDCSAFRPPFQFTIKLAWEYPGMSSYATPLVGDVDSDGIVEVFAWNNAETAIYILNGKTGTKVGELNFGAKIAYYPCNFLLCDVDKDGKSEVLVVNSVAQTVALWEIKSITGSGASKTITYGPRWIKSIPVYSNTTNASYAWWNLSNPIVADLDGDGLPEFVVDKNIIDRQGNVKAKLGLFGAGFGHGATFPIASDLDGDGKPEIIVGTDVYKYANGAATLWKRCPGFTAGQEGQNMVADVNCDGTPDVVYIDNDNGAWATEPAGKIIVWTPSTGATIGTINCPDAGARTYPVVGDIDGIVTNGKKYPEICYNTFNKLYAFYYDGTTFKQKWMLPTNEGSGLATFTFFDFNRDGIVELVYRDEQILRIMNGQVTGAVPSNLYTQPSTSGTIFETPIVADITGDGSANIAVSGSNKIQVFEGAQSPWAACPRVWNQQLYSSELINSDLTVITGVASVSLNKNGHWLYNGGPMQTPLVSKETFEPVDPAADVFVVNGSITVSGTAVTFTVTYGNQGMVDAPATTPIQFYKNAISPANVIGSTTLGSVLAPGQTKVITKTINVSPIAAQFYVRAVDDGTHFPAVGIFSDCDLTNNTKAFGTLELIKEVSQLSGCIGSTGVFTVTLKNNEIVAFNNIQLTDSLSLGWEFISATSSSGTTLGTYNSSTRSITWTVPSLAQGETVTLSLMAKAIESGTNRNFVWVSNVGGIPVSKEYKSAYVVVATDPAPPAPSISPAGPLGFCDASVNALLTASGSGVSYQWYRNYIAIAGATNKTYTATQTGSYSVILYDGTCYSAISKPVVINAGHSLMYWKQNAGDNNWNNPANWVSASGTALNAVPAGCTTVHIPGNANKYPSLDEVNSPRSVYGMPECDRIVFHFGGEVAKPHYLKYNKAFIQYNYGYYNASHVLQTSWDTYSAEPLARQRWYALAAPLKKIVTGDFSLGGFPYTWQREFKSSRDNQGDLSSGWHEPDRTVDLEVGAKWNYAISLYVPKYDNAVLGLSDHKHLDNLHGIFELPYFETPAINLEHRLHTYSGGISRIYYFTRDDNTFPLSSDFTQITRGNDAYRFVFEDNSNLPQANFKVKVPVADNDHDSQIDEVMIGNPFISSLDFKKFFEDNSGKIEGQYRLYNAGAFETFSASGTPPLIAPMQAFFIKPKGSIGADVELVFTVDHSVARSGIHQLKAAGIENSMKVKVTNDAGSSWVTLMFDQSSEGKDIAQMFSGDTTDVWVPKIYTYGNSNLKNAIQYVPSGNQETSVPLGIRVKSLAKGTYRLSFENPRNLAIQSLRIWDKETNTYQDLLLNDTYTFTYSDGDLANRFVLLAGKQATGVDHIGTDRGEAVIYTIGNTLYVETSGENISEVSVAGIQGIRAVAVSGINSPAFSKLLPVATGVYIVTVKLDNGETKNAKVVIR